MKVIVLDITNQYARFFGHLFTQADVDQASARVNQAIHEARTRLAQDEDRVSFGNRGEFFRQMQSEFAEFLASDEMVRIYNPMAFNVSTIEGFPRNRQAELLRDASTVEKTSLVATALLRAASENGETAEGRVCLVLEEAHSLTPEPTEGLTREDQRAVHQTARAVLQGRKYGYGCLLVSQRTANVTKTILNQCHTVFALRSYDATGIGFLANYLGDAYSKLLSSLPQYHCAAFGGGISCDAPVIMRLNHPDRFEAEFWEPYVHALRGGQ